MKKKKINVKTGGRGIPDEVKTTQSASEKVDTTVTTFLSEGRDGFQKIRITTNKIEPKRCTLR